MNTIKKVLMGMVGIVGLWAAVILGSFLISSITGHMGIGYYSKYPHLIGSTIKMIITTVFLIVGSILYIKKLKTTDSEILKKIIAVSGVIIVLLIGYSIRNYQCSSHQVSNAIYQIDPLVKKEYKKSCMTFGIYKIDSTKKTNKDNVDFSR